MAAWLIFKRFWFVIPIVGLAFAFVWQRGTLAVAESDARAAEARVDELTKANETLSNTIDMVTRMRVDNDAIAAAVAAKLGDNQTRETKTHTVIEKVVQNDPQARDWASTPIPDRVREALRAGEVDPGAP